MDNLLQKHFGVEWREMENLRFYKEAIDIPYESLLEGEDEVACGRDVRENVPDLRI